MSLGIGAVAVVDGARIWFPNDAPAALDHCIAAVTQGHTHVGVHWGMCVTRDDKVFGRVGEVADRLAAVAQPGEIVSSWPLWQRAVSDTEPEAVHLGEIFLLEVPSAACSVPAMRVMPRRAISQRENSSLSSAGATASSCP